MRTVLCAVYDTLAKVSYSGHHFSVCGARISKNLLAQGAAVASTDAFCSGLVLIAPLATAWHARKEISTGGATGDGTTENPTFSVASDQKYIYRGPIRMHHTEHAHSHTYMS